MQQNSHSLVSNSFALAFRMIIRLIISLYTTRIIINALGVDDYGIYNVVAGFSVMFSFVNSSMSNAFSRFLSYDIGLNKSVDEITHTFKLAFSSQIGICLFILFVAEIIGIPVINYVLSIPQDRIVAANILYQCILLGLVVTMIQIPYTACIVAYERMKAYAYIEIVYVSLLLIIAIIIQYAKCDLLILYGILLLGVYIVILIYNIIYCKRFGICKIGLILSVKDLKPILKFTAADLFSNLGMSLQTQGQNIIFNKFYGLIVNASVGVANQVYGALLMFSNSITTAIRPQIIKSYASEDKNRAISLMINGSSLLTYFNMIICIPLLVRTDYITELWLGTPPALAATFAKILLINHCLFCCKAIYVIGLQASGRIGRFSVILGGGYTLSILFQYIIASFCAIPELVFAIVLLLSLFNILILFHYLGQIFSVEWKGITIKTFLAPLLSFLICYHICDYISNLLASTFIGTLITMFLSALLTVAIGYFIMLDQNNRRYIMELAKYIYNKLHR